MWMFSSICDKYIKYTENYIGCIDRNIWGTSFTVYDDGYSEDKSFPEWIG